MDTEASEGESDSEISLESQASTCSDQSNNSNQSNHCSYIIGDGECPLENNILWKIKLVFRRLHNDFTMIFKISLWLHLLPVF